MGPALSRGAISVVCILIAMLSCSPAEGGRINEGGERVDNDYFAAAPDDNLLRNVESYHLTANKFWASYKAGKFETALAELRFVLRYFPNHPKALLALGSMAKLLNTPSLASSYFERAIKLYPQHALTHAQYGLYLVDIGNTDFGTAKLKEAIKIAPKLSVAHAWLAQAYYKSGKPELARQVANEARQLGYRDSIVGESPNK